LAAAERRLEISETDFGRGVFQKPTHDLPKAEFW
jgi:hypothetical protein